MLPGTTGAVLVRVNTSKETTTPKPIFWPDHESSLQEELKQALSLAETRRSPIFNVKSDSSSSDSQALMMVAYPLKIAEEVFANLAVEIRAEMSQQTAIKALLDWSNSWLDLLLNKTEIKQRQPHEKQELIFSTLTAGLRADSIDNALGAVAENFSTVFSCHRVCIGVWKHQHIELANFNEVSKSDTHPSLGQLITQFMESGIEQRKPLIYFSTLHKNADRTTKYADMLSQLSEASGSKFLYTIPILDGDEPVGAVTLENRDGPISLDKNVIASLKSVLVALLENNSRLTTQQNSTRTRYNQQLEKVTNVFKQRKALPIVAAALVLVATFGKAPYRVSAEAALEGEVQRVLAAPFKGYVAESFARAGDTVKLGEVIAQLDTKDVELEKDRVKSQRDEAAKSYRLALAELDNTQAKISQAKIAQADAKIALLQENINRAALVSPLDGIVISGDLGRQLGAPVTLGEILYTVAPLDAYRVVLLVDERDITNLKEGQTGRLSLSSIPSESIEFTISRIATEQVEKNNRVFYRTEATIKNDIPMLRPGMQGLGKIDIEKRNIGWIAFHRLIHWMRFELWSLLP